MTLRERENQIFSKYRSFGEQVIPDGALGQEYETARPRLLVILKEPNDPDGSWLASGGDIRDFGRQYNRPATWNNLARWSALAREPNLTIDKIDVTDIATRQMHLRRIAVVNLKKFGGASVAKMKEIREHAAKHWILLEDQFKLYRPDLTISGGVFDILREIIGAPEKRDGNNCFRYFEHRDLGICFDFYHPQARLSNKRLFEFLKQRFNYHWHSKLSS
jgi:hypothetical protein